jgi:hypothetical protein
MPVESHDNVPKVMRIHLQLSQYPILADTIRERMREEIFRRGVILRDVFEQEAREKAILSQRREGILNPYQEEPAEIWGRRLSQIRDYLTDFYFAYNLPHKRFEEIVQQVVLQRSPKEEFSLTYNPELAPWDLLFHQADEYQTLPPEEFARVRHHLEEIKVVLIKAMISDQLAFVRLAKEYLTIDDLKWIRERRIGQGKIGGKAAGLMLAWKILQRTFNQMDGRKPANIVIPESYFIGADAFYDFLAKNDLAYFMNQKYKTIDQVESEYPQLQQAYLAGRFPDYVAGRLRGLLTEVGNKPLIVRSSSLLEDSFEASFAGKYESVFCPNQGTPNENLAFLMEAIARVYASVANPDAIMYRKQMGWVDYDERMAILIQVVQGEAYHDYFFPAAAGVAYSRNPFLWSPKLRREDGFVRIVSGLGTRAVQHTGEDYPRMVALSHPQLRPEAGAQQIRYYSQYYMDVLDIKGNCFKTARVHEVLAGDYPPLRWLASLDRGDYVGPMVFNDPGLDPRSIVLTFDGLLKDTNFVEQLKGTLKALEFGYGIPVDIEFTVQLGEGYPRPTVTLHLLQCRPQSGYEIADEVHIPEGLPESDVVFGTQGMVPTGRARDIRYIVYVDLEKYRTLDTTEKLQIGRVIGRLNQRLEGQNYMLMGPGRWGSSNPDLGVKIGYADIYNTCALVEVGLPQGNTRPTLSYGTHFFQDLVESRIYPLAIYPGEPGNPFRRSFFEDAMNALPALLPDVARYRNVIKVIDVPALTGGRVLELAMSGEESRALAYFKRPSA